MQYVYVFRCGEDHYKVGIATFVSRRIAGLQTSNPLKVEVVATRLVENARAVERKMHDYLVDSRSDGGTEWFKLTPQEVIDLLVIINKEPEVMAAYDIVEMNRLLAAQLENRKEINKKLNVAIAFIQKKKRVRPVELKTKIPEKPSKHEPEEMPTQEEVDQQLRDKAIEIFREEKKASTSLLQRRLRIGYARAARVVEELEKLELIGKFDGSRAREVF